MFQYLYDFPLSTNQLIKKIGFQLYFGSCLLIVRSCLRGWEPEETPLCSNLSVALRLCQRKIIVVQNSPFVARGGSDVVVEVERGVLRKE